jgi:hypothetical protein
MKPTNWSYMLRLRRNPERILMDRLGEYLREFALLLGVENEPVFKGIKRASTGIRAQVSDRHKEATWKRIALAKHDADSKTGRHLRTIENMVKEDQLRGAELLDSNNKVVYLFNPTEAREEEEIRIRQFGTVDGVVTGLVGADDTMHLHLRDTFERDIKVVVRDESMARRLLSHFREGTVRLEVRGTWIRTGEGWVPENNRCVVYGFEVLESETLISIFDAIRAVPGNKWCEVEDPESIWRDIRGIN